MYEGTTCERSQTHHERWPRNITDAHAPMIQPAEGSGDISERVFRQQMACRHVTLGISDATRIAK